MSSRARASVRLFVAVDPPEEVCRELAGWARALAAAAAAGPTGGSPTPSPRSARRGRPSPPARAGRARRGAPARPELRVLAGDGLHITLAFLGSRPVEEIEPISEALASCSGPIGELSVGAPLWLPPRRPRALAVEIHDPSGELERLQRELSAALQRAVDWQPGRRRFRAHLTLARTRGREAPVGALAGEAPAPATPPLRFTPETLTLYRSLLHPEGAAYEALATQTLSPAAS